MIKLLKNYYFNNNLLDYLEIINQFIDDHEIVNEKKNVSKELNNKKETQKGSILKVNDANLLNIINSYFDNYFSKNRNCYYLDDKSVGVIAMSSRYYNNTSYKYWYTVHTYQMDELKKYKQGFLLLYFKDSEKGIIVPLSLIEKYADQLGKSNYKDNDIGMHIHIQQINNEYFLRIPFKPLVSLNEYTLKAEKKEVIKISSEYKFINIKHKK